MTFCILRIFMTGNELALVCWVGAPNSKFYNFFFEIFPKSAPVCSSQQFVLLWHFSGGRCIINKSLYLNTDDAMCWQTSFIVTQDYIKNIYFIYLYINISFININISIFIFIFVSSIIFEGIMPLQRINIFLCGEWV